MFTIQGTFPMTQCKTSVSHTNGKQEEKIDAATNNKNESGSLDNKRKCLNSFEGYGTCGFKRTRFNIQFRGVVFSLQLLACNLDRPVVKLGGKLACKQLESSIFS